MRCWLCLLMLCCSLLLSPAHAGQERGPWGMTFMGYFRQLISPMAMLLEGRGPTRAAFTIFATGMEVRSPAETINGLTILRDKHGFPIHGLWIETQHIRFSPMEIMPLVTMANAAGFHTMVRVPVGDRRDIQGYLDTGAGGLIVPVTETAAQIDEAFKHTFYGAMREAGYGPDLQLLQDVSTPHLNRVDETKVLAFMIESVKGVENIEELVQTAGNLCDHYHIRRRHIVFWMGPFDLKLNRMRLLGTEGGEQVIKAYADKAVADVSQVVRQNGFTMGGHMPNLEVGKHLLEHHEFSIFTIAGASDSAYNPNPDVPSTAALFGRATAEQRLPFVKAPTFTSEESKRVDLVMGCMRQMLTDAQ